ncbi:hypothetical protein FOMPIDRAFT_116444 [Fomitopsis schrenkii]|uniref:Retrotransposon gag domain-containing protein n=1 Tax=Fomitopsis schrenkii TaxID=2126942 RepID=S8DJ08_FOMSC|nr:hypothetical protein FOMPIDRAFT_116444 [Fomitopsis schrenkii]
MSSDQPMLTEFEELWNNPSAHNTAPTSAPSSVNINPDDPPAIQALAQAINTISSLSQAQATFAENQQALQQVLAGIASNLQSVGAPSAPSVPSGTRRNLVTDYDKSIYLSTWLQDGSPKSWFWAIEKTNPHLLHNHDALLADFRRHFGDSDFVTSQMNKIDRLTQRSSASKYASAFHEIIVHLPIHDDLIKINMFKKGLRSDVKALFVTLTGSNMPTTIDAYIAQAIAFDNSLHAQAQELKVDAIRHRGPVSPQERQRHRDQGLCAYCGGKHKIDDCEALAKRNANGGKKSSPGFSQQGKAKPEAH